MENRSRFSEIVSKKLGCYVYRLIDPRNGITFYLGRGQTNRVFSHAAGKWKPTGSEDEETLKLKTIRAIKNAGFQVEHVIHRHGMDERIAKEVESALIGAYPGLTNVQCGDESERGVMHADEVIRVYEAPEAEFRHDVILINVNKSSEDQDLLDAVRYAWRISPDKAQRFEYVLAVRRGLITGAFKAREWLPATTENFPGFSREGYGPREGRYGFRGDGAPENVKLLYLHKRVPDDYRKRGAANPIRYIKKRDSK